jgi:hypothetical protein
MEDHKLIPLTQGQFAKVSPEDYDQLTQRNWYAHWNHCTKSFYARARINGKGVLMHRLILGITDPKIHGDHRDMDTLNNTRANLRTATASENGCNRIVQPHNKSGLKGVWWCKQRSVWRAEIRANGVRKHLGSYPTKEDAFAAYCAAAPTIHGEFARVK